ncbi:MAG: ribosome small subunit-dependent GTPase A [Cyclobacteriaceae bacterium]|nr:ribosome small subunit-dependent GTPase A [Cyclobacteriaceae bacterium]
MIGLVLKSTGSWYEVLYQSNTYLCRTRGKLKLKGYKTTNPIAVGDLVEFNIEEASEEQTGVITSISSRKNYIIRKSIHKTGHAHIIAANIDQAIIIATLAFPRTSLGFIDRFTVAAESFRIPVTIIFNKMDTLEDDGLTYADELITLYENIGFKCIKISAFEKSDITRVGELLNGKISLIAGHSGVGKSTIINALNPEIGQKIGEVSLSVEKGTHTTTFAQMFPLENETFIIDTPGIKEYGLVEIEEQELSDYFPEMRALIGECKFHNCSHTHEPGCAIVESLNANEIAASRYHSYLSMLENDDNRR